MEKLIQGLREFQSHYFCDHHGLFEQLSHGQKPRVLFIACSDSRVDPNLITQAQIGDLFVIRNAGNLVPPYGATNGGEGASIEYAIHALDIQHVIICGHSHCGAMKGLLKVDSLRTSMPLVCDWLKHAEATRRLIQENYGHLEGEELIELTVAENVLTQLENLRTYPVIHSRLCQKKITLHAWVYHIETGSVMAYNADSHSYVPLNDEYPICSVAEHARGLDYKPAMPLKSTQIAAEVQVTRYAANSWLPVEQQERIYRGKSASATR
jgi:carbonic anhydrase